MRSVHLGVREREGELGSARGGLAGHQGTLVALALAGRSGLVGLVGFAARGGALDVPGAPGHDAGAELGARCEDAVEARERMARQGHQSAEPREALDGRHDAVLGLGACGLFDQVTLAATQLLAPQRFL